ncbi:MAG: YARHG domain-containing protein [Bacteroidota bacterium]
MKLSTLIPVVILSVSFFACGDGIKQGHDSTEQVSSHDEDVKELKATLTRDPRKIGPAKPQSQKHIDENIYRINAAENPLYGYWVGAFGKNKINIALAYTEGDSIFGHSVCAGNFRPIKGTVKEKEGGNYAINMWEPGDDKYDGAFQFEINLAAGELAGTWEPYKKTTAAKEYTLRKRDYKYEPSQGDFPDASTRQLEIPDVENFLPEEIEMIRNEIYARHGYSFKNIKIRRIFDAKDWYIPMSVDIRDQLTPLEAQNIDLLYNYEEYYDEYYDEYGR